MAIFTDIAGSYDDWYKSRMGAFVDQVETDLAFGLFPAEKGMKVLDVGCGTGNFSLKLAKRGCRVTGIDITDEMLEIAREKAAAEAEDIVFRNMDLYKLDFPDDSFDAVFSMAAFEFVMEPAKAIEELFRVVKKGGRILVGTIHGDSSWGRLYKTEEFQQNTVFRYARFMTLEELTAIRSQQLEASGQCLFLPPDTPEEEIGMAKENALAGQERGGFICALWKK